MSGGIDPEKAAVRLPIKPGRASQSLPPATCLDYMYLIMFYLLLKCLGHNFSLGNSNREIVAALYSGTGPY